MKVVGNIKGNVPEHAWVLQQIDLAEHYEGDNPTLSTRVGSSQLDSQASDLNSVNAFN